ncbi:MAG TPA: MBL fold metallo-hydrolase, partial [Nonomuraea sp.]|nr:MBL fold metallo-hydrolase [Nonomuraea sp.]
LSAAYGMPQEPGLETAFDFVPLEPGSYEIGPFTLTAGLVNHPVEAYGFRVAGGGRVVAYSGDTGECHELVKLAASADLLLCEASFVEQPDLPTGLHLTGRQAAEHAAKAGVGRLVLTHLVPWNDQATVLADASRGGYAGPVELARSGTVYDLA